MSPNIFQVIWHSLDMSNSILLILCFLEITVMIHVLQ